MDSNFDPIIGALNTSLNLRLMNHNVITSNIANSETPHYKAKTMEFEGALRDVLNSETSASAQVRKEARAHRSVLEPVSPEIYEDPYAPESLDGNTVHRAQEMSKLAENQLLYDASVEMLKKKLGMLRYVVTDGGNR